MKRSSDTIRNDARSSRTARREDGREPLLLNVLLPAAALFTLTLVVFAPVTSHQFLNWDDPIAITANPAYNPPTAASLLRYWTEVRPTTQFYVPVTQSIWWALAAVAARPVPGGGWEFPPGPFHAIGWFSHAAAAVLAFVLIRRLVRNHAAAWAGAALFALHPLQVEPVAWAASFYTSLSVALALAALWQLDRFLDLRYDVEPVGANDEAGLSRRRSSWIALAIGSACLVASLLTKPAAVLAPIVGFVLETGVRRRPWRQVAWPCLAWMLACAPVMVLAKLAQPPSEPYWLVWKRPFLAADALTFYGSKVLLPLRLAPDYGRSPEWLQQSGAWHFTWFVPVVGVAALLWAFVRGRSAWPLACGAAFVAALLPTLGLSPFDYQTYSTVADRYAYFAIFAVAVAAAQALTVPRTARGRKRAYAAAACVLTTLAVLSHLQTYRWRDSTTLFRYGLTVNPDSLAAHLVLGDAEDHAGNRAQANEHFRLALRTHPDNPVALRMAGDFSLRMGQFEEAVRLYQRAAARPNPPATLLSNLGGALFRSGRQAEAVAALERAIALEPQHRDAHLNLAIILFGSQQWAASREHFEAVLSIDPKSPLAQQGLTQLQSMGH